MRRGDMYEEKYIMSNKTIKPKQEKMIEQVIATMAVENMMLSRNCYKNL